MNTTKKSKCEQANICLLSEDKTLPNAYTEWFAIDKITNVECQCYCNAKLSAAAYVLYNNITRKFIYSGGGCMKHFKKMGKNINDSKRIFDLVKYIKIDDMFEYSDMIESIILKGYTRLFEKNKDDEGELEYILSELNNINLFESLKEQILNQIKLLRNERERVEIETKENHQKEMLRLEEIRQEKVKLHLEELRIIKERRIEKERLDKKYKEDKELAARERELYTKENEREERERREKYYNTYKISDELSTQKSQETGEKRKWDPKTKLFKIL